MKASKSKPTVNIGLCGFGVVGQGVWRHLKEKSEVFEKKLGSLFKISRVAVRDMAKEREIDLDPSLLCEDPLEVANDPEIQIVCELMGGTEIAREVVLAALSKGKIVVTANKALLCFHGKEIFEAARKHGGHIFFEASVAGGIPIIKALREGLIANRFSLIYGILNGTCNFILTHMEKEGQSYEVILDEAKRLGYAEADEALDVDGWDSAHKASILAFLAHGKWVSTDEMLVEGIREITQEDFAYANKFGYSIKLLAVITRDFETDRLFINVQPTLISRRKVLANVDEVYNGICVCGDVVGTTFYMGEGAGQNATASAVIADLADAVSVLNGSKHPLFSGEISPVEPNEENSLKVSTLGEVMSKYYIRVAVMDIPGVLAKVATILSNNGVSIASVLQQEGTDGTGASIVLTTHKTSEEAIQKMVKDFETTDSVLSPPVLLKIGEFED
ncbi:MAG: homoserine dehydrogenase [Opitutaceae bacterium]|nr:homoserine dehydrogenase [Opitutaceae bacterium]